MTNTKQQTAVEWFIEQLQQTRDWQRVINEANQSNTSVRNVIEQAKEMNKEQSQAYAAFCVACDRKELPLLEFDGWVKLEGNNKL
jgi:undecaprenyl pyrophosphate synthase